MDADANRVIDGITQIMVDAGWRFIHNGHDKIERAINEYENIEVDFESDEDFLYWLIEKASEYV